MTWDIPFAPRDDAGRDFPDPTVEDTRDPYIAETGRTVEIRSTLGNLTTVQNITPGQARALLDGLIEYFAAKADPKPAPDPEAEKMGRHYPIAAGLCRCGWDALEWFPPSTRPANAGDPRAKRVLDRHCRNANAADARKDLS